MNKKKKISLIVVLTAMVLVASAFTLAFYISTTDVLANSFETTEITTKIEEEIGELKQATLKRPVVKNEGPATGFIRARVLVSPQEFVEKGKVQFLFGEWKEEAFEKKGELTRINQKLYDGNADGFGWIYCEQDGFYYYNKPIEKDNCTESLFDAVWMDEGLNENFDITIYQEAVSSKHYELLSNGTAKLETMKAAFEAVNKGFARGDEKDAKDM